MGWWEARPITSKGLLLMSSATVENEIAGMMNSMSGLAEYERFLIVRRRFKVDQKLVSQQCSVRQPRLSGWEKGEVKLPEDTVEALWRTLVLCVPISEEQQVRREEERRRRDIARKEGKLPRTGKRGGSLLSSGRVGGVGGLVGGVGGATVTGSVGSWVRTGEYVVNRNAANTSTTVISIDPASTSVSESADEA